MTPEDAYSILEAIAEIHGCSDRLKLVAPSVEEQAEEETAQEIDTERTERAANFSFAKCHIAPGEEIEYYNDPEIKAVVVDDRSVEYEGEILSLTALAKKLSGKNHSIAGPKYFKYKGEWLNDIRKKYGV